MQHQTVPQTREIKARYLAAGMTVIDGDDGPMIVTVVNRHSADTILAYFEGQPEPTMFGLEVGVTLLVGEPIATDKFERPVGDLFTVSGEHGRVSYDQFANRVELVDAYGAIEAMGKRWADQVAQAVEADDDDAVFALLAEHYRTELAGGAR